MNFKFLEKDGKVILTKFDGHFNVFDSSSNDNTQQNSQDLRMGAVIDVETTGLDPSRDKIIEVGLMIFKFNKLNGNIVAIGDNYSGLEDPEIPLSDTVSNLTGLTNEVLHGKKIDWPVVSGLLEKSDIIIAHNASFDRSYIDKVSAISSQKVWACSAAYINWIKKGFSSSKLENLAYYHGFFVDSHRALNDVHALMHLLTFKDYLTQKPYLLELLESAKQSRIKIFATSSPYESKDLLKHRGYSWNPNKKVWWKILLSSDYQEEISWLEKNVYTGKFLGQTQPIRINDTFKSEAE